MTTTAQPETIQEFLASFLEKRRARILEALKSWAQGEEAEIDQYHTIPAEIDEFITHRDLLNRPHAIYPKVMECLVELNDESNGFKEAVLTGAIGAAKTTIALYTQAYQLYKLGCMKNPHETYNLDPASEIMFIFQSMTGALAKVVEYERFRAMLETSPFFRHDFDFDREIKSRIEFANRVICTPVSGTETAAIGQNVISGIIDELNFMEITAKSKKGSRDGTDIYDQAVTVYNSICRRRKSRFIRDMPGVLCLVSSKRYPGQFTDVKIKEAETDATIYVYDKRTWEIKPEDYEDKPWFRLFVGDGVRLPYIMSDADVVSPGDRHLVIKVPEAYLVDFKRDIMGALRDIAGVSTSALHPFMMNSEAVDACFNQHDSIFSHVWCDFEDYNLKFYPDRFYRPGLPRWVHIDLAVKGDSAGVVIGCVSGFQRVERGDDETDEIEVLPEIRIDGSLEVRPPRNGEILFFKIRALLYKLRDAGLNIKWISFDSFQSTDSIQILRSKGYVTGTVSMDRDTFAYDICKTALYDGRVTLPDHPKLLTELVQLERDPEKGKIDHPPHGSKDVADALAGVVSGLTMRTENWFIHGVEPFEIPDSIREALDASKME